LELIAAARESFASDGYAAALLDVVAQRAGVTKGALYHHFDGKKELFEAVYQREQQQLAAIGLRAYAGKRSARVGFYDACVAFLEASLDPAVQRITLIDGPAVLGWERLREIQNLHTLSNLRAGIQQAVAQGMIAARPVEPLVQILNGAICEAAMYIARAIDAPRALQQVLAELRVMIDALIRAPRRARATRRARDQRTGGAA
jgi:AcrR family transcriptional regulator